MRTSEVTELRAAKGQDHDALRDTVPHARAVRAAGPPARVSECSDMMLPVPDGSPSVPRRLTIAVLASVVLVLSGPYVGQIRGTLRSALSTSGYIGLLNGVVVAVGAAVLVTAFVRARNRLMLLFCLAGLVVAAIGAGFFASASANASQSAVERFHFIEYGIITWLFYRAALARQTGLPAPASDLSVLLLPAIAGLLVSLADEWFQWFVPERIGEWPDILLNGNAIAGGLLFSLGMEAPESLQRRWQPGSRRLVGRSAAVVVLAAAAFLHAVHLGHEIHDPAIGTFRSRYTAAELDALAHDRSARWQVSPPAASIRRLSREDQYLAEASWHVQARNADWDSDLSVAWHENLILERYFAPALDTASYVMPVSRWPPGQRADAERRMRGVREPPYESHAARLGLYLLPPWRIWAAAMAILLFGYFVISALPLGH